MKKHGLVKKCMTFALGAALIMGMAGCGPGGGHCGAGGSGRGDDTSDRGCSQSGSGI